MLHYAAFHLGIHCFHTCVKLKMNIKEVLKKCIEHNIKILFQIEDFQLLVKSGIFLEVILVLILNRESPMTIREGLPKYAFSCHQYKGLTYLYLGLENPLIRLLW